jgi:NAD-dependent deacetylase
MAVVELEKRGKLHALITQNTDGLHIISGIPKEKVIEVHGTMRRAMCLQCDWRDDMQVVVERLRAGEEDPACTKCGGILKSDTISFGQALIPEVIERAMQVAGDCDLMIAIGSTLQVYPVAGAVPLAKRSGAKLVILNAQATQFDDIADAVLNTSIGEALPYLFGS